MTAPVPRTPIVEAKVKTSAAAAAVVGLALALIGQYLFKGGPVPSVVEAIVTPAVTALVTGGITYVTGWLTRHTPRDVVQLDTEE
jgi:hypothetical protein